MALVHDLENYEIEREIGHGSFATVYKGWDKMSRKEVAIKAINTERLNKKLSENLATEISIMKEFKSSNIVELYDLQKAGKFIYLIMEYCNGGDLSGLLRKKRVFPEDEARSLIRQLAQALQVLFKANFAHRDLKPQNILLCSSGTGEPKLKLGDFGFARFVDPEDMAETLCGSPLYMAPEILRYEKYDGKADLWSVGAILYEMIYGRPPFKAQNHIQLLKVIESAPAVPFPKSVFLSEAEPERPVGISEACKDLILGLLKKNPDNRLTFEEFITHPFLDDKVESKPAEPALSQTSEPVVQQRGFFIPKIRQRSGSAASVISSFNPRRSSISASFKQQSVPQGGLQSTVIPLASTLSAQEDLYHQEEERMSGMYKSLEDSGVTLKLSQRDTQLALLLLEISEANLVLVEKAAGGPSPNKALLLETLNLFLYTTGLFQSQLCVLKESGDPSIAPSNDHARSLVLWLYSKLRKALDGAGRVQAILEEGSSLQATGISITSSTLSSTEPINSVSEILFNYALKCSRDGGLQELLGHVTHGEYLYTRSIFILKALMSQTGRPTVFLEYEEALPSQHDTKVIQGYTNVIQQRLNTLARSPA